MLKSRLFATAIPAMKITGLLLALIVCLAAMGQNTAPLRLNQIQVIGSHNSYKKLPDPLVMKFLMRYRKKLGKKLDPQGIDYGHLPIDEQM
ncbi:MAG TPA: Ca2+-dependent phosphoinositide-specific phospholipase C, partial [Chitinophagales bacterium]|nr:Ca2+-dependent phosphoinositide-specific phospholipase C [Chitinophagales bacterium]